MQRILEEFMELVRIDSASKNERAIADAVVAKLKEIGCETWEDDAGRQLGGNTGNIYAVLDGGAGGSLLFSSHLDRVANGLGIRPRVEGSRIVSDGTILAADDVSGVAAILDGLRRFASSGISFPRVEVLFTVCEEVGVTGSRYVDYSQLRSRIGFVLDSPGRIGRVVNAAPSKARVGFEVRGKNAHAGNAPEKGINAVTAAAKILAQIKDGRIDPETTANFSSFEAQGPTNVVNDFARVRGEIRSRSAEKLDRLIEELKQTCERVASETGAVIIPEAAHDYSCFYVDSGNESIRLAKQAFAGMGIAMRIEPGGGGMDANRYNAMGIESIGIATGYTANHSTGESLEIEDLIKAGEWVERVVREYASADSSGGGVIRIRS